MYCKKYNGVNVYDHLNVDLIEYLSMLQSNQIDIFEYRFDAVNASNDNNAIEPSFPANVNGDFRQIKPLRKNLLLEFEPKTDFTSDWNGFLNNLANPIPYAILSTKNSQYLILPISRYINAYQHESLCDSLASTLKIKRIKRTANSPLTTAVLKSSIADAMISNNGSPYEINDATIKHLSLTVSNNKKDTEKISVTVDDKVLTQCLDRYLEDIGLNNLLNDNQAIDDLITAVIASESDNLINKTFEKIVLYKLSHNDKNVLERLTERFKEIRLELTSSSSKLQCANRIGDILPLYSGTQVQTLAQQFLETLGSELEPNSEMDLSLAGQFISRTYPPHLLATQGTIRERLVIFNPLTGLWTGDEDIFLTLLNTIRPYSTSNDLNTMLNTFASQASASNKIIRQYSGSRYLLFRNGMLDVAEMKLHKLHSISVKNKGFTDRTKIELDFIEDAPEPTLEKLKLDGSDWRPSEFISAYGNNDPQKIQYLLFGLSLGLFAGHNFGVHFDIQGTSRWGKTTISELYQNLFNNRVQIISFPELNGNFPFTSYPDNTSVIWIKECNIGVDPLNDEQGTVIYDGLADDQVRFRVKGRGDIVLQNPPQVYIDGTQLIQATEITTGPAGRTLAYILPSMTQNLRQQAYSTDISRCFRDTEVLQWFVSKMIKAYRSYVPKPRINNFKLNLALDTDLQLIPPFARQWRNEFANKATGLGQWFDDAIIPYISTDKGQETIMHNSILYRLYGEHYAESNPYDRNKNKIMDFDKFEKKVDLSLKQAGFMKRPIGSTSGNRKSPVKKVTDRNAMNFDWVGFESSNSVPNEYTSANSSHSQPFGKQKTGWYQIVKD